MVRTKVIGERSDHGCEPPVFQEERRAVRRCPYQFAP